MSKIVSVHSFRGGTGKSNTTANLASLLALGRARLAVVDTDIRSPGIHILFNLDEAEMVHSLNDYLRGKCAIKDAAHDDRLTDLPSSTRLIARPRTCAAWLLFAGQERGRTASEPIR